jgi:hypothetical protein
VDSFRFSSCDRHARRPFPDPRPQPTHPAHHALPARSLRLRRLMPRWGSPPMSSAPACLRCKSFCPALRTQAGTLSSRARE